MRFKHFILNEQDPMLGGGPGGPPPPGAPPGGDPLGGMGDPMMGGGPPGGPMGGGPGGPGGDPMGGGMGGPGGGAGMAPQVPVNMKDRDVWEVLGDLLGEKQPHGDDKGGMLQSGPQPGQGMKPPGFLMQ